MDLIIVESPTKAKTIQGFVGKGYKVVPSFGHIVDLPPHSFGISIKNNFSPKYVVLKKKVASFLQTLSNSANTVLLAMDPDREGEAIAYHIKNLIKRDVKRILFYEITKRAILTAIKNPTSIDLAKVESQQTRRILDRIVGYDVSPLLWKIFHRQDLSAGRVQSVALRLICEREEEVRNFKPQEFWEIYCQLDAPPIFEVKLVKITPKNETQAKEIEEELKNSKFVVSSFLQEERKKFPSPPYITSTLQQEASYMLNFTPQQTMQIAQQLFEGIQIEKGKRVGFITYMRTDSLRVASHAIQEVREYIKERFGVNYLPTKIPKYSKKEEGAHEAIRPTSIKREPEKVKKYLTSAQFKLYELIWKKFLASQMEGAKYDYRKIEISANQYKLVGESEGLIFEGFRKVFPKREKENVLPQLPEGKELKLLNIRKEQKFTKPKPRYSEGSMVKELESKGIGRPSTYAPIISRIIEKGYVKREKGKLIPTELGEIVNKLLVKYFSQIFDVNFTRKMEESLDKIEKKLTNRLTVLKEFYTPFKEKLTDFWKNKKEIQKIISPTVKEKCEVCGSVMIIRWSKYGKFLACSSYPTCKNTKPFTLSSKIICPKCKEGKLVEKKTKKGKSFYACNKYPACDFTLFYTPVPKECPKCNYPFVVERKGVLCCTSCKTILA